MNTNVYEHPTVSWDKAKTAFDRIQRKEGELIAAWIELGTQLNLLRAKFPANQEFGAACLSHGIDLTHQHRKAAMWLAALDADQLDSLRQYFPTAIHPASLERRCREQFPEWLTSTRSVLGSSENADQQSDESEKPANPTPEPEKRADEPDAENAIQIETIELGPKNGLVKAVGYDIAQIIYRQWTSKNTRLAFGVMAKSREGKKTIKRIAGMVESYCARPSKADMNGYGRGKFSHRLLIDDIPTSWARNHGCELTNTKAINAILDEIDDANRMMEELGVGRPLSDYEAWWDKRNLKPAVKPTGPDLSAFSTPETFTPRIRPAADGEIRVYGQTIYPCEGAAYTHDEAWAAFKFWEEEDRIMKTATGMESPSARGRHFMGMCEYLNRISTGFYRAFHKISRAQHFNAAKTDDTFAPHQRLNEV